MQIKFTVTYDIAMKSEADVAQFRWEIRDALFDGLDGAAGRCFTEEIPKLGRVVSDAMVEWKATVEDD